MSYKIFNPLDGKESLAIHINDRNDLIEAMRFKAKNIKALADPEIFEAVADALENSVEVRHGKWEPDENKYRYCSNCKEYSPDGGTIMTPYCPNCGAKMYERKEE